MPSPKQQRRAAKKARRPEERPIVICANCRSHVREQPERPCPNCGGWYGTYAAGELEAVRENEAALFALVGELRMTIERLRA